MTILDVMFQEVADWFSGETSKGGRELELVCPRLDGAMRSINNRQGACM
jgi:hypothetical protein